MFTCKECLKRAFSTLHGQALPKNPNTSRYIFQPLQTTAKPSRPSRRYATVATRTSSSADATDSAIAIEPPKHHRHHDHTAPVVGRSAEWAARKELDYLKDPLHIANRVRKALDSDDFKHAAEITRQASKHTKVAVSWNHLIDYELKKDRIHSAFKLYNEMKKRAQLPNAQTFTIIFRGCARSAHPKLAVSEAVKLYNNMVSIGRIKPNTVHLNAVLQVCAKVEDLDSMFSILQSSDDSIRSPNNLTYTTILNALRAKADKLPSLHVKEEEIKEEKESAIRRSKAIWEEVISKWRSGSIIIDEELVCAMGRILLMGGYLDADAIEGLIEQTMMIPREDNKALPQPEGTKVTKGTKVPAARPRSVKHAPGAPAITHALPGNNSLSLILAAVEKTGKTTKATKYWNLFTRQHHVVPDADNWFRLIKVLLRGKNSGRTATCLREIPSDLITKWHVQYAMKTCLRDNLNRNALDHATEVLKVMEKNLSTPDVDTLRLYLRLAHASKRSYDEVAKSDYEGAMSAWAKSLLTALDNLWLPYQTVAKKCNIERPNKKQYLIQAQTFKAKVVDLARKMVAAYDILVTESLVGATVNKETMKKKRDTINWFVLGHYEEVKRYHVEKAAQGEEDVDDSELDTGFSDKL
ncbi:hypothetical protein HD806DRAFT_475791 [Xylariaceae sp. AK1471]|nr:hypothetical protein HD806DRAFT_475791 [Xylariaceae sp. AK1471]